MAGWLWGRPLSNLMAAPFRNPFRSSLAADSRRCDRCTCPTGAALLSSQGSCPGAGRRVASPKQNGQKRGFMFRSVWLALVFSTAAAAASVDLPKLRHLSEAQPAQALADGRLLLDGGKLSDDPSEAREVLRWMGRAALILSDEAAIAEV